MATLLLAACSSGPPGPPSASLGSVETRTIPSSIENLTLTDQHGAAVSLATFHGKAIMLVPFLTLCSDICPLTTGNLLQVEQALVQANEASRVQIVEVSVDPGRDTPNRLAAYAHLTGGSWELVTPSDTGLAQIAGFFGFSYQQVPQDNPPAVDWLTGKPLTYDVNHSDGYILIDPKGQVRFSTGASPDFHGKLNPTLHKFLNDLGRQHLAQPSQFSWDPTTALGALGWILQKPLAPPS
ncbi:MAG: SCO family protein [Acidimicrobiales bacterium]